MMDLHPAGKLRIMWLQMAMNDGNIYCVDCISKNVRIMKEIDKAITAEDSGDTLLFCEGCEKEIKRG